MPRIRTIKPEFWSSPGIEATSPWSRLLFIAMWNWADDAGRGTCQLRELQAFAFPYDEDDAVATMAGFKSTLAEVRDQYDVTFYKVGGRPYYAIPSWKRHQRNERTAKSKYPAPEEGEKWDFLGADQRRGGTSDTLRPTVAEGGNAPAEDAGNPGVAPEAENTPQRGVSGAGSPFENPQMALDLGSSGTSDIFRQGAAEAPQTSDPGTGEQGNRGTGEQGSSAPSERGGAARPDDATIEANAGTLIAEWIDHCNKRPPGQVIGHVGRLLKQMLAEPIAYDDVRRGLAVWATKGIHPSTLPSVVNEVMNASNVTPLRPAAGGYQPYRNPTDQSVYDEGLLP
ncbi:hypothetical protein [Nocardiopsis dassonvillei]|uniref:hypothetical protein n=1 Tax=Nocardiopsis dassonvillei TaxID=2014 RepID=UPI00157BD7BC|nr:hypothetical protein [Nocardiopsis dassonvillei]